MFVAYLFWLASFAIGLGVKHIDAAYDDGVFTKKLASLTGVVLGALVAMAMIGDHSTFLMFGAIILGVFLAGKLDILPFRLLAAVAIVISFMATERPWFHDSVDCGIAFGICVWTITDEWGNDRSDQKLLLGAVGTFFRFRGVLKVGVLLLTIFGLVPVHSAMNFAAFDLGYLVVGLWTDYRTKIRQAGAMIREIPQLREQKG
jgi:hypothetical protein